MSTRHTVYAWIVTMIALFTWSNPVMARLRIPIEKVDFRVVTCPGGKEGTCVQIVNREGNNITANELAMSFGTTGQSIRALNPDVTIPICKKNGWKKSNIGGLLSRKTNEYWKNECADEALQDAYLVPGEIITISNKPLMSFNQRVNWLAMLEQCQDADACIELLKSLTPNAKGMDHIYVLKDDSAQTKKDSASTLPLPTKVTRPTIAAEPIMSAGAWIALLVGVGVAASIALLIGMVVSQRRQIRHLVAKHNQWVKEASAEYTSLECMYGEVTTWLNRLIHQSNDLTGEVMTSDPKGSDPTETIRHARACVRAIRRTIDVMRTAEHTAGTNPTDGASAVFLALVLKHGQQNGRIQVLETACENYRVLVESLDQGMRDVYVQLTGRSSDAIPQGRATALAAVHQATDELIASLKTAIQLLTDIVFGAESQPVSTAVDGTGINTVAHVLRDINEELALLCQQPSSSPLLKNLRTLAEGQQGTVAMYRDQVTKQAAEIATLRHHLRLAQEALDARSDPSDDPPGSNPDEPEKPRITLVGLPPPDDSGVSWAEVDRVGSEFIRKIKAVTKNRIDVVIDSPRQLHALFRVWAKLSQLQLFFPTLDQKEFGTAFPFRDIADSQTVRLFKSKLVAEVRHATTAFVQAPHSFFRAQLASAHR